MSTALLMLLCLALEQKAQIKAVRDFALPVSMVGAMTLAIFYAGLLGG